MAISPKLASGDCPPNPLEKPGYRLEFHDKFDESNLNTAKWLPFYLPHWSSRAQSKPNYRFENSNLILQITQEQQPWCPEFDGEVKCSSIQTGEYAGPVGSELGQHRFNEANRVREAQTNVQLYTPQYGYFELRAKAPADPSALVALWMIGYEDAPERSGEIAVMEIKGAQVTATASQVGYGIHPWGDPALKDEFYEDRLEIDARHYHIYAVEWLPDRCEFYVDNQKIRTVSQSPTYPMQFMLGVYELPGEQTTAYPKNFIIDYFRAYQPNA